MLSLRGSALEGLRGVARPFRRRHVLAILGVALIGVVTTACTPAAAPPPPPAPGTAGPVHIVDVDWNSKSIQIVGQPGDTYDKSGCRFDWTIILSDGRRVARQQTVLLKNGVVDVADNGRELHITADTPVTTDAQYGAYPASVSGPGGWPQAWPGVVESEAWIYTQHILGGDGTWTGDLYLHPVTTQCWWAWTRTTSTGTISVGGPWPGPPAGTPPPVVP